MSSVEKFATDFKRLCVNAEVISGVERVMRMVTESLVGKAISFPVDAAGNVILPDEVFEIVKKHKNYVKFITPLFAVPAAGEVASATNIWMMYKEINDVLGIKFSENILKSIASGVIANLSGAFVASLAGAFFSKFIPGAGSIVGAAIDVVVFSAITYTSGYVYLKVLSNIASEGGNLTEDELKASVDAFMRNNKSEIKAVMTQAKKDAERERKNGGNSYSAEEEAAAKRMLAEAEHPSTDEVHEDDPAQLAESRSQFLYLLNVIIERKKEQIEIDELLLNAEICEEDGDADSAKEIYLKAANMGSVVAMRHLGNIYNAAGDKQAAIHWYTQAANKDDVESMVSLGNLYKGNDYEKAKEWLLKAADMTEDTKILMDLAEMVAGRPDVADFAEAFAECQGYLLRAANKGNIRAMASLGYNYKGNKEYDKAKTWFAAAANKGDGYSMNQLGLLFDADKDFQTSAYWYKKSAETGFGLGIYNYGVCFETGEGMEKNKKEAIKYYIKAARAGVPEAMYQLVIKEKNGYDPKEMLQLLKKAEKEYEHNRYQLGRIEYTLSEMYEEGIGTTDDDDEAIRLRVKAASLGWTEAKEEVEEDSFEEFAYELGNICGGYVSQDAKCFFQYDDSITKEICTKGSFLEDLDVDDLICVFKDERFFKSCRIAITPTTIYVESFGKKSVKFGRASSRKIDSVSKEDHIYVTDAVNYVCDITVPTFNRLLLGCLLKVATGLTEQLSPDERSAANQVHLVWRGGKTILEKL